MTDSHPLARLSRTAVPRKLLSSLAAGGVAFALTNLTGQPTIWALTMSIFIANLAFPGQAALIDQSKLAILAASGVAGVLGWCWLRWLAPAATPATDS